jgi:hypothetical protein
VSAIGPCFFSTEKSRHPVPPRRFVSTRWSSADTWGIGAERFRRHPAGPPKEGPSNTTARPASDFAQPSWTGVGNPQSARLWEDGPSIGTIPQIRCDSNGRVGRASGTGIECSLTRTTKLDASMSD